MPEIEIHYSDGWAALYVDGKLHRDRFGSLEVGDSYNVEETTFGLLGVRQVHDDAFMRGQDQRGGVAQTLVEVEAYRTQREARKAEATRLREQAEELQRRAAELELATTGSDEPPGYSAGIQELGYDGDG